MAPKVKGKAPPKKAAVGKTKAKEAPPAAAETKEDTEAAPETKDVTEAVPETKEATTVSNQVSKKATAKTCAEPAIKTEPRSQAQPPMPGAEYKKMHSKLKYLAATGNKTLLEEYQSLTAQEENGLSFGRMSGGWPVAQARLT